MRWAKTAAMVWGILRGHIPRVPRRGLAGGPCPARLATARPKSLPTTARPPPFRAARGKGSRTVAGAGLSHAKVAKPAYPWIRATT